jgi:hypothetical protein
MATSIPDLSESSDVLDSRDGLDDPDLPESFEPSHTVEPSGSPYSSDSPEQEVSKAERWQSAVRSHSSSEAEVQGLREAYESSALRAGDASKVGTDYGIDVSVGSGLDELTSKLTAAMESGLDKVHVASDLGRVPEEGREALEPFARSMAEGMHDHSHAAKDANAAQALGSLQGAQALIDKAKTNLALANMALEEKSDTPTRLAAMSILHGLKHTESQAPVGAIPEYAKALIAVNEMTARVPDPAALSQAHADLSALQNGSGKADAGATLEQVADRLTEAYGDKAKGAAESVRDLATSIREGADNSTQSAALDTAQAKLDGLTREVARETANTVYAAYSKADSALAELAPARQDSYEKANDLLGAGSTLTGSTLARMAQGIQSLDPESGRAQGSEGAAPQTGMSPMSSEMQGGRDAGTGGEQGATLPATENLREVLGESASGMNDTQVTQAMGEGFAERVQDLGITKSDVEGAMAELQGEAVREGRDPATVDEAVAVAALVERENVLDQETGLDRPESDRDGASEQTEPSRESTDFDRGSERAETESMEHAESEQAAEMEMAD